jgi:hypothetical protein
MPDFFFFNAGAREIDRCMHVYMHGVVRLWLGLDFIIIHLPVVNLYPWSHRLLDKGRV